MDKGRANKLFRPSNGRDSPLLSGAVSRVTTGRRSFAAQSDTGNDSAAFAVEVRTPFCYFHHEYH